MAYLRLPREGIWGQHQRVGEGRGYHAALTRRKGLLRNDPDKRWVNGTIARIARLEAKRIWIEVDDKTYELEPVSWEARRYAYDQAAEKIVENVTGTFRQFPVRLAWALTIHKSQGLTSTAFIDLGRNFATGKLRRMSRCRSLEAGARPAAAPSDIFFDRSAMGYREKFTQLDCLSMHHMRVKQYLLLSLADKQSCDAPMRRAT
jgi:hypothetical protein